MKFFETHFEEYTNNVNMHTKISKLYDNFPDELSKFKNLIMYGPSGVGKYSQMLFAIKRYSPSDLKYEKKISINFYKTSYYFKISDIHYEIDMALLGCQSKLLWNDIYNLIIDIINATKSNNMGIIVCKNFHEIHNELLETFYSYMQTGFSSNNIDIKFIILTEEISFIPNDIINACKIINIERPSKNSYNKLFKTNLDVNKIGNIKMLKAKIDDINYHQIVCDKIIDTIIDYDNLKFATFRDLLYDILIYNINIFSCCWYILNSLTMRGKINHNNIEAILKRTYRFFQYYNNNYRPIYHLENYLLFIATLM